MTDGTRAHNRGEARHPLDPRSYARPSFSLPPTTATDESRFQKRTRTPWPALSYPSAIYDRRCTARNICPIGAKEKDKTALFNCTCVDMQRINFTSATVVAQPRAFAMERNNSFKYFVYAYPTYIFIQRNPLHLWPLVTVKRQGPLFTLTCDHCTIRSYLRPPSFAFAKAECTGWPGRPAVFRASLRNSIGEAVHKSTWIGSSILSSGAGMCLNAAARKARRKCTYCARSLRDLEIVRERTWSDFNAARIARYGVRSLKRKGRKDKKKNRGKTD